MDFEQTDSIPMSMSEEHGLGAIGNDDVHVYSVGISTGGVAEIKMAAMNPARRIIATTIDPEGVAFAKERVAESNLEDQIEVKIEDIAKPLPYDASYFDYIYARLVLHYLPKQELIGTLSELYRTLKPGGKLFVVVRSDKCEHAHMPDSTFDQATELTEYTENDTTGRTFRIKRHFFSEKELAPYVKEAGFTVGTVTSYDEQLFKDFKRTVLDVRVDNVIELVASKGL